MKGIEIAEIAKTYIGKTEIPNNAGFTDTKFQKKMEDVGWSKSLAWCSFFGELVWTEACCDTALKAIIKKLFSGSATTTFKNFDLDKTFKTGKEPKVGALAVWRFGNGWQGHLAVVVETVDKTTFKAVEGNTNDKGGREGYIVATIIRKTNSPISTKGLNLIGFIYCS